MKKYLLFLLLPLLAIAAGNGPYPIGGGGGNTNALTPAQVAALDRAALAVTNTQNNASLGGTFSGTINGNGSGLTNVPSYVVTNNQTDVTLTGTFSGNGTGLTNVQAYSLTTGLTNYIVGLVGSVNRHFYFSSATNNFSTASIINANGVTNYTMIDSSVAAAVTNSINVNGLANAYFISRLSTNTITRVESGPIELETYIFISGAGGPTVTAHPEIYLWFTNDTILEIASSPDLVYSSATMSRVNISMNVANSTNCPAGTRLVLRWKITSETGTPTWNFAIGGDYDSHISLNTGSTPQSSYSPILTNTAAGVYADFAAQELTITGNITFVGATNTPPVNNTVYLGATVSGISTVTFPAVWSLNNTNNPVTLTNGLVAFKAFGTNVTITTYQP